MKLASLFAALAMAAPLQASPDPIQVSCSAPFQWRANRDGMQQFGVQYPGRPFPAVFTQGEDGFSVQWRQFVSNSEQPVGHASKASIIRVTPKGYQLYGSWNNEAWLMTLDTTTGTGLFSRHMALDGDLPSEASLLFASCVVSRPPAP